MMYIQVINWGGAARQHLFDQADGVFADWRRSMIAALRRELTGKKPKIDTRELALSRYDTRFG